MITVCCTEKTQFTSGLSRRLMSDSRCFPHWATATVWSRKHLQWREFRGKMYIVCIEGFKNQVAHFHSALHSDQSGVVGADQLWVVDGKTGAVIFTPASPQHLHHCVLVSKYDLPRTESELSLNSGRLKLLSFGSCITSMKEKGVAGG